MQTTEKQKFNFYPLIMVIGIAFMLLFGYVVKPFSTVTELGVKMLGVLIGLIIITCFNGDLLAGSLLALVSSLFHGYLGSTALLAEWLGSAMVVQIIFCGAICLALKETGAMNVIAKKLLTNKLTRGKPILTMMVIFFVNYLFSAFVGVPATYIIFFGLLESIRDVCGYKKDDPFIQFSLLGIYLSALGAFFFAFKAPQVMTIGLINATMAPYGVVLNEGQWMVINFVCIMLYMLVYAIMMKTVYKINLEPLKTLDFNEIESMRNTPDHFNKEQLVSIYVLLACIVYILIISVYPATAPGYDKITFLGTSWVWILACAGYALFRARKTGKPFMPIMKLMGESTMWVMIALAGALTILGKVTSDAALGIRPWLVDVLSPIFGGRNIWVLMAIVVLFSTLVTQIANGLVLSMAVCPIVAPFVCELAATTGINPHSILIISNICAGYAFWTVAASSNAVFILSRPEITQKFVWTKGLQTTGVFMVIAYIVGMIFTFI